MSSEQRLRRLRDLILQFERLPASPERERLLREVRARVVDLDTGFEPRAMLPVDEPVVRTPRTPAAATPQPPPVPRRAAPVTPPRRVVVAGGAAFTATVAQLPLIDAGELLSLDDSAGDAPKRDAPATPARRPWTLGLRG